VNGCIASRLLVWRRQPRLWGLNPMRAGRPSGASRMPWARSCPILFFGAWLKDSSSPKHFRDSGHFWGVAPGTPARVIQTRILDVDRTLEKALGLLDAGGVDEVAARHGKALFDRADIERAKNFHAMLKERFARDLATLQVQLS